MTETIQLHGRIRYLMRRYDVVIHADRNYAALLEDAPWLMELPELCRSILNENASINTRFAKLERLATRIESALAPHAPCSNGCTSCCHIPVTLSAAEATRIGRAISVTPQPRTGPVAFDASAYAHLRGTPCPFLADERCSIYAHRPIACRLHFTLDLDDFFCDLSIPNEGSLIPNLDLREFWIAYGLLSLAIDRQHGELREFFPHGLPPAT